MAGELRRGMPRTAPLAVGPGGNLKLTFDSRIYWRLVAGRIWTEDETLLAFRLYNETQFGRIHARNPQIRELAQLLGRTPDAVAMKMLNLASFDPRIKELGKVALYNTSRRDGELWEKFHARTTDLLWASTEAAKRIGAMGEAAESLELLKHFTGTTEFLRETPQRRAQRFFRQTVLASYNFTCAVSGIDKPELLNASHIIPWSNDVDRRTDPRNGLALSALHDRAFDRGLISFDEAAALLVSPKLKTGKPNEILRTAVLELEGKPLTLGERFAPDPVALSFHRERIFKAG